MNVLLTSVGRRGYIIDYFKDAFLGSGKIFTSNSELTYTMKISDGYLVTPLIYEEGYINSIISFCKVNDIHAVLSLFDIDLLILAQNEKEFTDNGIELILAPEESIMTCNDKWLSYKLLESLKINTPKTYLNVESALNALDNNELDFPVIIKPRWGMASMGIYVADDVNELKVLYNKSFKDAFSSHLKYESSLTKDAPVIIQELLIGEEYGIDAVNDLTGSFVTCLAKQKVRMRAGETDLGLTVSNKPFLELSKVLAGSLGHRGILSIDCFIVNGVSYVTEMNCRISGHYPISHAVGFNFPELLKSWLGNEKIKPESLAFEENVYVCKELTIKRLD